MNEYSNIFGCPKIYEWISEYIPTEEMAQIRIQIIFEDHFIWIFEYSNIRAHHWRFHKKNQDSQEQDWVSQSCVCTLPPDPWVLTLPLSTVSSHSTLSLVWKNCPLRGQFFPHCPLDFQQLISDCYLTRKRSLLGRTVWAGSRERFLVC